MNGEKKYIDEQDMMYALKNNEFVIYYQPQVNLEGEVVGVEALARWFSKKHGELSPNIFIPMLEKNNLIYDFQNEIFDKACKQIQYLHQHVNKNIKLCINISPIQMQNQQFIDDINRIIISNNMDSKCLELEITESYDLKKIEKISETLNALKKLNLKVALDDFGKGYNSIKYLLEFPFDNIKIDKNYIDIVTENPMFMESMIKMIHSVNCSVVAEGIERKEQVDVLKHLGCDIMQGYYFYKPLSFNELLKIV